MKFPTIKLPDLSARSRYHLVWAMFIVALILFAVTRTVLMVYSLDNANLSIPALLRIFATGTIYDVAFYLYALVPVSLYLLLVPNRIWSSRIYRVVVHLACSVTVYGLFFIAASELVFWEEFEVRFNFISVDYLVYRREVTDNIVESYPLVAIFSVLLLLSLLVYWRLARHIEFSLQPHESFRARMSTTAVLWSLAAVAAVSVGSALMQWSENTCQNELSANGPHQFFSAFRNNELDYYQFYATIGDADASEALKAELQEPNSRASGDGVFNIRRIIMPYSSEEKRLNIMLVMIESLSAKYMGIFGDKDGLTPNLDRLAKQSLLFKRFYATGNRTTRGLEAVTLSIPPTPGRSIVKRLNHATGMWSLGEVLRTKGYETSFLYGGRGYFDNMNNFFSGNGYNVIDQTTHRLMKSAL